MAKRTLVIGDIHGGYLALEQCLKRSKFNYDNDRLIVLGDVTDGWPDTPECIEELMKMKDLIYVLGNHDRWLSDWFEWGRAPIIWTEQGGYATIEAYVKRRPELLADQKHKDFFRNSLLYFLDEKNRLFVHGGFDLSIPIRDQSERYLTWDREMFAEARWNPEGFMRSLHEGPNYRIKEIFIGHTTTSYFSKKPVHRGNLWNLDQGAGWEGRLSIMDVDTYDFWQSDKVTLLYPWVRGRA